MEIFQQLNKGSWTEVWQKILVSKSTECLSWHQDAPDLLGKHASKIPHIWTVYVDKAVFLYF